MEIIQGIDLIAGAVALLAAVLVLVLNPSACALAAAACAGVGLVLSVSGKPGSFDSSIGEGASGS